MQVTPAARVMARVLRADFHEGERVQKRAHPRCAGYKGPGDAQDAGSGRPCHGKSCFGDRPARIWPAKKDLFSTARHSAGRTGDGPTCRKPGKQRCERSQCYGQRSLISICPMQLPRRPFQGMIVRKNDRDREMVAPGQRFFIIQDQFSHQDLIAPVGTGSGVHYLKLATRLQSVSAMKRLKGCYRGRCFHSGDVRAPGLRLQILVDNPGYRYQSAF